MPKPVLDLWVGKTSSRRRVIGVKAKSKVWSKTSRPLTLGEEGKSI